MATLIKQACVLGADEKATGAEGVADVLIEGGRIEAIAPSINPSPPTEIIEAKGQYLGPGLIDLYSQNSEPGNESRETHESLRQAAAAGGFTRVGLLPNSQPAVESAIAIQSVIAANKTKTDLPRAALMPWAAMTIGAAGEQLTELAELSTAGAVGFTDGLPLGNAMLRRRFLEYAQPLGKPIALWPCDLGLAKGGVAREGVDALRLGLAGVSVIAETTALSTLLECVAEISTPVHIMRVSTARSVALIRQAKSDGLPISASVSWHHLLFDTHHLQHYDPNLRHDPPLGTPADRQALIAGVEDGAIDAIAIDHSPYTYEEKTVAFDTAPPGAIGLELALPMLWKTFVASGQWSPAQLWWCLSQRPAKCLGLAPSQVKEESLAELTLFDPGVEWWVSEEGLRSRSSNTPWLNQTIQGKVTRIWR